MTYVHTRPIVATKMSNRRCTSFFAAVAAPFRPGLRLTTVRTRSRGQASAFRQGCAALCAVGGNTVKPRTRTIANNEVHRRCGANEGSAAAEVGLPTEEQDHHDRVDAHYQVQRVPVARYPPRLSASHWSCRACSSPYLGRPNDDFAKPSRPSTPTPRR